MNILETKLKQLRPGDLVRLTQPNGNVIEGTVGENDGTALSVEVRKEAIINYSGISAIEIVNAESLGIVKTVSATVSIPKTEAVNSESLPGVTTDSTAAEKKAAFEYGTIKEELRKNSINLVKPIELKNSYGNLEGKEKNAMLNSYNSIWSAVKGTNRDKSKCKIGANAIKNLLAQNKFVNTPDLRIFVANVMYLAEMYDDAAENFYYADELKKAYECAISKAVEKKDTELYKLASAFSAMYIVKNYDGEDVKEALKEALQTLEVSAATLDDVSGIEYVYLKVKDAYVLTYIDEAVQHIAANKETDISEKETIPEKLAAVKAQCADNSVACIIRKYTGETAPAESAEAAGDSAVPEAESAPEGQNAEEAVLEMGREYPGAIIGYNCFERTGEIEHECGMVFNFKLDDITDQNLKNTVSAFTSRTFRETPVYFYIENRARNHVATKIRECFEAEYARSGYKYAATIMAKGDLKKAFDEFKYILDNNEYVESELTPVFTNLLNCALEIYKNDNDFSLLEEAKPYVDKYSSKMQATMNSLTILKNFYRETNNLEKALEASNRIILILDENAYGKIAYNRVENARFCMELNKNDAAIDHLNFVIKLVTDKNLTNLFNVRDKYYYMDLAEAYFNAGKYEAAEDCALHCSNTETKNEILDKVNKAKAKLEEEKKEDMENVETVETVEENYTVQAEANDEDENEEYGVYKMESFDLEDVSTLIDSYKDRGSFENLGMTPENIVDKAFSFPSDKVYCVTAYLSAAAYVARSSECADKLKNADLCVKAALGQKNNGEDFDSSTVIDCFENMSDEEHERFEPMYVAAALRTLFNNTGMQDYSTEMLEGTVSELEISKEYPSIVSLASNLNDFRSQTGYGISEFADYKTNEGSFQKILDSVKNCRDALDKKQEVFEAKGRLRRTRDLVFINADSVLRSCLEIACANDSAKADEVKQKICDSFIRKNKPFEYGSIDISKVDKFIDSAWDEAKYIMRSQGHHVNRPNEKLIAPKRTNVVESVYKVLKCIIDWVNSTERIGNEQNPYATGVYAQLKPSIVERLNEMSNSLSAKLDEKFDWGLELLRRTVCELLGKMTDCYDELSEKYFYIDFLKSNCIQLSADYQPELYATFCDKPTFNILSRIERHASMELPAFPERINEIFRSDTTKHNLRGADLIREYGEECGIEEITGHTMYQYYDRCVSIGRERLINLHEDFLAMLELYQSYGAVSNINGEKEAMIDESEIFFRICLQTCDFSLYSDLLDVYRAQIDVSADTIAQRLHKQLDELKLNSKYEFGSISEDEIRSYIDDKKFSTAENLMQRIRRNDTLNIKDFSSEPIMRYSDFIESYTMNYRVLSDGSVTLVKSIQNYTGKNNLEMALRNLKGGNINRDVRGGVSLLRNWLVGNNTTPEKIGDLMYSLGFGTVTAEIDSSIPNSFIVKRAKRTGRVNYHYPLPAFSSVMENEGVRVVCLYGKYDTTKIMDTCREINTTSKHTIILLDYALKLADRRHLARKMKEEKTFAKTFIVIDRMVIYYLALHYQSNIVDKALMSITMPFAYYQPFSATNSDTVMPPEIYTGREAELTSIEDVNGCNLVFGGRQLGKSALLNMAAKHVDGNINGDRALVVDIQGRDYNDALKWVTLHLIRNGILDKGCQCDNWDDLVSSLADRLNDEEKPHIGYLLLMLDEADKFIESCREVEYKPINAFKLIPEGRFKLVMAGLHKMSSFNRKEVLGNNSLIPKLKSIIIRPFMATEGTELLTHAMAYMGFRFEDKIIQLILTKTMYFPGLIQLYCQKLLESMKNSDYAGYNESETPIYEITEEHMKKVLSDNTFKQEADARLDMTLKVNSESERPYYWILAHILAFLYFERPNEKGYTAADIRAIADSYSIEYIKNLNDEQLPELLGEMCDLNIFAADEEYYMFSSIGFRDFIGSKKKVHDELTKYMVSGGEA